MRLDPAVHCISLHLMHFSHTVTSLQVGILSRLLSTFMSFTSIPGWFSDCRYIKYSTIPIPTTAFNQEINRVINGFESLLHSSRHHITIPQHHTPPTNHSPKLPITKSAPPAHTILASFTISIFLLGYLSEYDFLSQLQNSLPVSPHTSHRTLLTRAGSYMNLLHWNFLHRVGYE